MTQQTPGVADHAAPDVPLILREPVRLYLYGLTVPVVALLVGLGLVTSSTAALIGAVAAAVFAVPVTEVTRRAVVSPATAAKVAQLSTVSAVVGTRRAVSTATDSELEAATREARATADWLGVPGTATTLPLAA